MDASLNNKIPLGLDNSNCNLCDLFCTSSANNFKTGVVTAGSCAHSSIALINIGVYPGYLLNLNNNK